MSRGLDRNLFVQRWGTPQEIVGSVNEPREREERGHRFNERWTYHRPHHDPTGAEERVLYWLRYDFVASYARHGTEWQREDPAALLVGLRDRAFRPVS